MTDQTLAHLSWLESDFKKHSSSADAEAMSAYMRNLFPYYGIKKPLRAALSKPVAKSLSNAHADPEAVALWCWEQAEREWQYFGQEFLAKSCKTWNPTVIEVIEKLIVSKSWWDTVDSLAVHGAGKYFTLYPEHKDQWIEKWRQSDNVWLVRVSLIFQLMYKSKTDSALLFDICSEHAGSREFFIRKAIGWALRQYAYTNPEDVIAFVNATALSGLSRREALKNIEKKRSLSID